MSKLLQVKLDDKLKIAVDNLFPSMGLDTSASTQYQDPVS